MSEEEPRGIGVDDLPAIYREGYLYSVEMARAQHDPATDWEGFREYLWDALIRVFGLDADIEWPADVPRGGAIPTGPHDHDPRPNPPRDGMT